MGLGCMNLSHAYGAPPSHEQAAAVLQKALDLGIDHFDSAALYGFGRNEELVGPFLKPYRDRLVLVSKCGMRGENGVRTIDGRPEKLREDIENSLRRLETDVIDLYYLHRYDKVTPIEDSIGELERMVDEGKVRSIGLSETSAATIRNRTCGSPDCSRSIRVLAVEPQRRDRGSGYLCGTRHCLCRLFAAGARLPDVRRPGSVTIWRKRHPAHHAAIPGAAFLGELPVAAGIPGDRRRCRLHAGATGAGLGPAACEGTSTSFPGRRRWNTWRKTTVR